MNNLAAYYGCVTSAHHRKIPFKLFIASVAVNV
jgi:hypothetical protein